MTEYANWDCKGGEMDFIGEEEYEAKCYEAFWEEYNKSIVSVFENSHLYGEHNGGIDEELMIRFENLLEEWKDNFVWRLEEEEEEEEIAEQTEEEEEEEDIAEQTEEEECKCNKCDKTLDEDEGHELEETEEEREDCEECGDIGIECIWNKDAGLMLCEECFDYYIVDKEIIKDLDMKEKMEN